MRNKLPGKIIALLLAGTMLLSCASCGKSSTGPTSGDQQTTGTAAPDTSSKEDMNAGDTTQKVKITLWLKPAADATEAAKKNYELQISSIKEKFPNLEIVEEALKPGVDYREQYDKALMAGAGPTVSNNLPYVDIQSRIANGTIGEMTEFVNNWDLKKQGKVWTAFDDAISKDGKWYAVPWSPYLSGTVYNVKALKAGGGDPENLPKTWAEFAALGQKVTDKKIPRFGYVLVGMDWNAWPFTAWVWSAGGEMVRKNADGSYKVAFNEDSGIDAAIFWNEMVWKYQMTQKDVLEDWNAVQQDAYSGRGVFSWGDPSWYSNEQLSKYGLTQNDMGFAPIPAKDSSIQPAVFSGGEVWTFNPKATPEQKKAGWDIIQLLTYDESYLEKEWKLADDNKNMNSRIPARIDLTDKKFQMATSLPEVWKKGYATAFKTAKPEPYCAHWNDLKNALAKPLQTIILKKGITRDEVKKLLDGVAEDLYKKYPETFKKG